MWKLPVRRAEAEINEAQMRSLRIRCACLLRSGRLRGAACRVPLRQAEGKVDLLQPPERTVPYRTVSTLSTMLFPWRRVPAFYYRVCVFVFVCLLCCPQL